MQIRFHSFFNKNFVGELDSNLYTFMSFSVPEPIELEPEDPCDPDPCGRYAFCKNQNGYAACMCKEGYFGSPPNCRPECQINADCPNSLACIGEKCKNPCVGICGENAECYVKNHNAICKCLTGYIGDPFSYCKKKPEPPRDPCVPNPCGRNAIARVSGNRCICECESNFFGDPFVECKRECEYNRDCAITLACSNYKCVDPCANDICGINAQCRVQNHNAICSCIDGYFGDPFTRCDLRKLLPVCMRPKWHPKHDHSFSENPWKNYFSTK